jgi:hypothetical protein
VEPDVQEPFDRRHRDVKRLAGVVLDPLAEVGVGVLVAVLIRCRQLVVNFERSSKGRQRQEDQRDGQGNRAADAWPAPANSLPARTLTQP